MRRMLCGITAALFSIAAYAATPTSGGAPVTVQNVPLPVTGENGQPVKVEIKGQLPDIGEGYSIPTFLYPLLGPTTSVMFQCKAGTPPGDPSTWPPDCPATADLPGAMNVHAANLSVTMLGSSARFCRGILDQGSIRLLTATVTQKIDTDNMTVAYTTPIGIAPQTSPDFTLRGGFGESYTPSPEGGDYCLIRASILVKRY